jgi:hypothetical protein
MISPDLNCPLGLSAHILTQGKCLSLNGHVRTPCLCGHLGDHVRNFGIVSGSQGPHQDELVVGQFTGPVGFGTVPLKKSLCAVDLVFVLPSG